MITDLQVVLAFGNGDHVRVGVNLLFEELCIAGGRAESHLEAVERDGGHTRLAGADENDVAHVTGLELIQDGRTETMRPVEREVREYVLDGVVEAARPRAEQFRR